jgi:TIR domain
MTTKAAPNPAAGPGDAVFISYTHVDNKPFGPEKQRWISLLDEHLSVRLEQLAPEHQVSIWRDDKLQGNDVFADSLKERLGEVAVLISVCSPKYLLSEWCQRELNEFVQAAQVKGGLEVGTKSRVFKVMKTPVPLDELPPPLAPLLGYEFYELLPEGDRFREFLLNPDEEARWKFYARADDLAQDIVDLLDELDDEAVWPEPADETVDAEPGAPGTVYLAATTSDVSEGRDDLKRELRRRGYRILPDRDLPLVASELSAAVADCLSKSDFSIHLLGGWYGARPEGEDRSIPDLQLELARGFADRQDLTQFIGIEEGREVVEEEQVELIDKVETTDVSSSVEVIRAPLDRFKAHVLDTMSRPPPATTDPGVEGRTVYLVYDQTDGEAADALQSTIEAWGYHVVSPLTEGSESEVREVHETSMVLSDAVLIYYGKCTEHWVRMRLLDLMKVRGWGRTDPYLAQALWVGPPDTPHKAKLHVTQALVLNGIADPGPTTLEPFLARLEGRGASGR